MFVISFNVHFEKRTNIESLNFAPSYAQGRANASGFEIENFFWFNLIPSRLFSVFHKHTSFQNTILIFFPYNSQGKYGSIRDFYVPGSNLI